ncbi:hypothetical protein DPMN_166793 [Dreissena polymorpha]|uniref:Uncharacterized protein n=1 Tax=Dreissena polymorpha TaxID=45954 RepID=A0A9D4IUH3_DREPO|nr:hypothetical protein DPMN_166793 [Dreissena polymorpha]
MVTCSSTCLRNLFSTLLPLSHEVECNLKFSITSCADGSDESIGAIIKTGLDNQFNMEYLMGDSPGLWEALHGLNIKSLSLGKSKTNMFREELLLQFLSSLAHLKTLSIGKVYDVPSLCNVLHGRNINDLRLGCFRELDLTVNNLKLLSQSLSSLIQLTTLSMCIDKARPGLWEALRGLNISSLSLKCTVGNLKVAHEESLSQSLSSLTQLETLSIDGSEDSPGLWEALRGLNIKNLSLGGIYRVNNVESLSNSLSSLTQRRGGRVDHEESLSQSLSSLTQLETLSIDVHEEDSPGLLEALRGLNIKSLSLRITRRGGTVDHEVSLSPSLSSLTQLETLSVDVFEDSRGMWEAFLRLNIKKPSLSGRLYRLNNVESLSNSLSSLTQRRGGIVYLPQSLSSLTQLETRSNDVFQYSLWEALRGLNIKKLSLKVILRVNNGELLSQSLSSLTQLETLSIDVGEDSPSLWEALRGLNIKKLSLSGIYRVNNVELLSNSLSSLTQLKTLSITVTKDSPGLWEALSGLNIKSLSVSDKLNGLRVKK